MTSDDSINVLENSLRDLIEQLLRNEHGAGWTDHLGVTTERLAQWEERREVERKSRTAGVIEERILYYSDFTDLYVMIKKNWDLFKPCFGDQTELRVYMEKLADFRNPDAHSRSLLPVEQQLVEGMTGELRQKITLFLSKGGGGPEPEHFARIEEVTDSFGNRSTGLASGGGVLYTGLILRPGDTVVFRAQAWDPQGLPLTWDLFFGASQTMVTLAGAAVEHEWAVTEADIGTENNFVRFALKSSRPYSRFSSPADDDACNFMLKVLPR
jgi:hypothetical protein